MQNAIRKINYNCFSLIFGLSIVSLNGDPIKGNPLVLSLQYRGSAESKQRPPYPPYNSEDLVTRFAHFFLPSCDRERQIQNLRKEDGPFEDWTEIPDETALRYTKGGLAVP